MNWLAHLIRCTEQNKLTLVLISVIFYSRSPKYTQILFGSS
jgi:hypothetical protein